jgi:hypothetical protein
MQMDLPKSDKHAPRLVSIHPQPVAIMKVRHKTDADFHPLPKSQGKRLLSFLSLLAFCLLFANPTALRADRFEIITSTGSVNTYSPYLEISEGEILKCMSITATSGIGYVKVFYTNSSNTEMEIHRGELKFPIEIMGPCKIRIQNYSYNGTNRLFGIVKSSDANSSASSAKYATVIPENSKTNVSVVLEQSTDMVNWTTVNPGEFVPSIQKRFFRLRSANVPVAVTGASNASPIVITSAGHSLNTGDSISISGVQGNVAANGAFTVTKVDANSFSLNGSTGNGAYTSGGTWLPAP